MTEQINAASCLLTLFFAGRRSKTRWVITVACERDNIRGEDGPILR